MGETLLCKRQYKKILMDGRLPTASSVCEDISYYLCTNPTASITCHQTFCAWVGIFDPSSPDTTNCVLLEGKALGQ